MVENPSVVRQLMRLRTLAVLTFLVGIAPVSANLLATEAPPFLSVVPGTTTKAEVDLTLGEARGKVKAGADETEQYEYEPPKEAEIFEKLVIAYFPDTKQVARLDAYFKVPHSPETIRAEMQLGNRVLTRDRPDGSQEEFYYPKFNGLVLAAKTPGALALAVIYLSPRYLGDVYYARFSERLAAKSYSEARDEADKIVLVDPDYSRGYICQGVYFLSQKNFDEAIAHFVAATNAKEGIRSQGRAHAWLGVVYWQDKNLPPKAQEEFEKGIAINPQDFYPHYRYGQFLRSQKQTDRALAELTRAVELASDEPDARMALASFLYEQGDYAKALPHFEWLNQWVESPRGARVDASLKNSIQFSYAYCLGNAGQHERAIAIYEKELKLNSRDESALNNLAYEYELTKNLAKAVDNYRELLNVAPKNLQGSNNLGRVLLDSGNAQEALKQYEFSLSLKPDDVWIMVSIGKSCAALGNKKEAIEWIRKAIAAGFRDRNALMTDPYFQQIRNNGDFKKVIETMP